MDLLTVAFNNQNTVDMAETPKIENLETNFPVMLSISQHYWVFVLCDIFFCLTVYSCIIISLSLSLSLSLKYTYIKTQINAH